MLPRQRPAPIARCGSVSLHFHGPVIVTVPLVRVVQMAADEIVRVPIVRHGFMAAGWPMDVATRVAATVVIGCIREFPVCRGGSFCPSEADEENSATCGDLSAAR
jgi:hypothetical protein